MKITRFITELNLADEIVFITDPPLTEKVMNAYNERRRNQPDVSFTTRDGRLVVRRDQYESWARARPGGNGAELLAAELSKDEELVELEQRNREQEKRSKINGIARFFGVPAVTEDEWKKEQSQALQTPLKESDGV